MHLRPLIIMSLSAPVSSVLRWLWAFALVLAVSALSTSVVLAEDKSAEPEGWWDEAFTIRKAFTLDTTAEGGAIDQAVTTAPILVRLFDGNFNFLSAQQDLSDLRFLAEDGKTVLPHRIEKFDSLLNEAYVWVGLPEVKPSGQTQFWLYYGTAGVEGAPGGAEASAPVYGPEVALVYNFSESGAPPADGTKNGNNAETAGDNSSGSIIGGGLRVGGQAPITVPSTATLNWPQGGPVTWSAWVRPNTLQPNAVIFNREQEGRRFTIGMDNGVPYAEVTDGGAPTRTSSGEPVAVGTWVHLAVVAQGDTVTSYLNGVEYGRVEATLPALNGPLQIGGDPAITGITPMVGEMDELRISNAAVSPAALKLAAISQGGDAPKLLQAGEDELGAGGGSHGGDHDYFGIIFANLTIDGWICIYLLTGMAIVSWWVMIGKATYLASVTKGNNLFMKAWRDVVADLTVLNHGDSENVYSLGGRVKKKDQRALRNSPVFRIYQIGSEEIRHRLSREQRNGSTELSGRSIQAIRASLDGGLVRESARLNNGIVLLTIAISGGPFLGLLGTVVGVMITFAAVAKAGDVNVNAIAPGIAAALLATVAGLAVAIPALFGYNYLLTKIKGSSNDMHVFIDEFISRMAEFYGDGLTPNHHGPQGGGNSSVPASQPVPPLHPSLNPAPHTQPEPSQPQMASTTI